MAKKKASVKKPASKPKKAAVSKSSAPRRAGFIRRLLQRFKHILILLIMLSVTATVFYSIYLSNEVAVKFEGKRWAVPARVYGRSLDLYVGSPVSEQQLKAELKRLGYRHQKDPAGEGTWGQKDGRYLINTRGFDFWDEAVSARDLLVVFSNDRIQQIRNRNTGVDEAILRLEAPMIDSIYPAHNEDRILVKFEQLPPMLLAALIVVEDRDFYEHYGINPKSIARAMFANIRAGHVVQGGSTLTQQLVKNFFLSSERSLVRKFNEALMALIVDARYDKQEILEAYANEIYLGQEGRRAIHGFGLASRFYFNRPIEELDLSRIALLVGMIKGPSWYDPVRHPERAKKRRDLVLDLLAGQGVISSSDAERAKAMQLGVAARGSASQRGYPDFIKLVRQQLRRDYREQDLTSEGLRIFTTLDPWVQDNAEKQSRETLYRLEKLHKLPAGKLQVGAVIANPSNGEVLAIVGSRASQYRGFNRALDAVRPIGSLIKPFVYLTALMQPEKYSLMTRLQDEPVSLKEADGSFWRPKNYDGKLHGDVTLQAALAKSYNLPTVRLGMDLGLPAVIRTLQQAGLEKQPAALPSLLLGSLSLSPLEVTQLYQTLSAGGFYSPLRTIREVLDSHNQPLSRYPLNIHQTLPAAPVYILNTALQAVVSSGTAKGLNALIPQSYELAGKTGTTNDLRDSWFAGFSQNRVATVWVGRDDNKAAGLTGASGAMKVWGRIMRSIDSQPLKLQQPADVEWQWIDTGNGLVGDQQCENAVHIPFARGYAPSRDSACRSVFSEGGVEGFFNRLFN